MNTCTASKEWAPNGAEVPLTRREYEDLALAIFSGGAWAQAIPLKISESLVPPSTV